MDGASANIEYEYDLNGNMTKDLNKKISSIKYNSLNLPQEITFSNGNMIKYAYSSDGIKQQASYYVRQMNQTQLSLLVSRYYCSNMTFEYGTLMQLFIDGGYIKFSGTTPIYHFYLKDHLGSNRMVVSADGTLEQRYNYYPFGGLMLTSNNDLNRYKFNGKELDRMHGLDWYDYGARFYDAAIGRWPTVAPLCEKYYSISPYAYCVNNPMNAVDKEGERTIFINGKIGFESPEAGNPYWGINGSKTSSFITGALIYFHDDNYRILAADYGWTSTAEDRFKIGYEYAKNNIDLLTMDLKAGGQFNFVSHSMGAALTEGIAKYLNEKGFGVSNIVHINPYQAADISTLESANTIDYQNTDDPVIHFIPFSSSGKIQNADQYIREFSGESLFYKHFWPISLGKNFWDRLGTYTYRLGTYIY